MKYVKEIMPYVIIVVVVVLFRSYIATPVRVDGDSMYPTLKNGQILILNKLDKEYERMEIVVFDYKGERLIKRVIGLPGDTVEYKYNKLYVNGKEVIETFEHKDTDDFKLSDIDVEIIPDDYYFVVGDNRSNSKDSRIIGLIHKNQIMGKTNFIIFPFNHFGKVE